MFCIKIQSKNCTLFMHQIRHFTKFMLVENLTQHTAQNKLT